MTPSPRHAIGCVSFLNARPLIEGLDRRDDLAVRFDVPSRLLDDLTRGEVDVALCPVIDYQLADTPLELLPVGGIGCDGPTLTVRLFSRVPLDQITRVYADTDSHTSVVLSRIILAERCGVQPPIKPLPPDTCWHGEVDTVLLIGDKVVARAPDDERYPHQLDLGEAWRELTGLPFVFAVWMTRPDAMLGALPDELRRCREHNADQIDTIVAQHAAARGWPDELAREYLGELLRYDVGDRELEAIELFWRKACDLGFIDTHRPLRCHTPAGDPSSA